LSGSQNDDPVQLGKHLRTEINKSKENLIKADIQLDCNIPKSVIRVLDAYRFLSKSLTSLEDTVLDLLGSESSFSIEL
jgi:hypothetical protein